MDIYQKIMRDKLIDEDVLTKDEPDLGFISSGIISFNLACSGTIDGAFPIGKITVFAADSMLGKSIIGMSGVRSAQKMGLFPVVLDAEYAWKWDLAEKMGIDTAEDKLMVYQNNFIENVQAKIMNIVKGMSKEDRKRVFFMLDSWGSLTTSEAVKKSEDPNSKKDMTEVLKKNRLANMLLNTQSTFYVVNAVYDNVGGFGDPLKIPGGKRLILNASTVIQGRSRAKESMTIQHEDTLTGSIVLCKVYKSRHSREHETFNFRVKYDGGLDIFYGILDYAIEGGFVEKNKNGYFTRPCIKDDKKRREREIYCSDFWLPVFSKTDFRRFIEEKWNYHGDFDVSTVSFIDDVSTSANSSAEPVE